MSDIERLARGIQASITLNLIHGNTDQTYTPTEVAVMVGNAIETQLNRLDREQMDAPETEQRPPLSVDALGLSEEQSNILRGHLASRRQTVTEFFGDVLMEYGLGRATGKDYPPAMVEREPKSAFDLGEVGN